MTSNEWIQDRQYFKDRSSSIPLPFFTTVIATAVNFRRNVVLQSDDCTTGGSSYHVALNSQGGC